MLPRRNEISYGKSSYCETIRINADMQDHCMDIKQQDFGKLDKREKPTVWHEMASCKKALFKQDLARNPKIEHELSILPRNVGVSILRQKVSHFARDVKIMHILSR